MQRFRRQSRNTHRPFDQDAGGENSCGSWNSNRADGVAEDRRPLNVWGGLYHEKSIRRKGSHSLVAIKQVSLRPTEAAGRRVQTRIGDPRAEGQCHWKTAVRRPGWAARSAE